MNAEPLPSEVDVAALRDWAAGPWSNPDNQFAAKQVRALLAELSEARERIEELEEHEAGDWNMLMDLATRHHPLDPGEDRVAYILRTLSGLRERLARQDAVVEAARAELRAHEAIGDYSLFPQCRRLRAALDALPGVPEETT